MNNPSVLAIVVTYNRKELLVENIGSLVNQTYKNLDILVVDNNSVDGTFDAICNYTSDRSICYVNTGGNIGGAGGFNFGIKRSLESEYDFIWLMDDDSVPEPDALEQLIINANDSNLGFLASKVLWKDSSICNMNVPRMGIRKKVKDFYTECVPICMATFVSLLIPQDIIYDVGLPIKEFFIWTDDLEFTRRISRKYKAYLVNSSIVVHKTNTNNGANVATDCDNRIDRYRYAYRNEVYLYKREGIKGVVHLIGRLPIHILRVLLFAKDNIKNRIGVIIGGTIDGISFNPKIEYVTKRDDGFGGD